MSVACEHADLSMMKLLLKLEKGVAPTGKSGTATSIVRARNSQGWTVFMQAVVGGDLNLCRWLYRHGAADDLCTASAAGQTPMQVAIAGGISHQDIVRQMQRWGVPIMDATLCRMGMFQAAAIGK